MRIVVSCRLVLLACVMALCTGAGAAADTLTGTVRDQSSAPVVGATVDVLSHGSNVVLASDVTTPSGTYSIAIAAGTYDVRVTPTSGGLGPVTALGITVNGSKTLNFSLAAAGTTTLSGRLLDRNGNGIEAQSLQLIPSGGEAGPVSITDVAGHYNFQVQPGDYFLVLNGNNHGFAADAPQFYSIQTNAFTIGSSQIVDLQLPLERVLVHVQDGSAQPVANAGLSSTNAFNCELPFGPTFACGSSNYSYSPTELSATTDGAGNVTLFLLPSPSSQATSYTLTATPRASSSLATGGVSNLAITSDTSVTISLNPPTVLTGRLLDAMGQGVPSQVVQVVPADQENGFTAVTDATGGFSFGLQAGSYRLGVSGDNQNFTASGPQFYSINSAPFDVTSNRSIDFQLPVKRVTVHVQDAAGNAVANAGLSTSVVNYCALPFGPTVGCGASSYMYTRGSTTGVTNAAGDFTLWLFPTTSPSVPSNGYRFTANPPSGSGLATTSISGVQFDSDTIVTITMAAPATITGRLRDGEGSGLPFQTVEFAPGDGGGTIDLMTDATGAYAVNLSPGSYRINVFGDNQAFASAAPQFYSLGTAAMTVSGNQTLDLTVPVTRLDVHVQDAGGAAVRHVGMTVLGPSNCELVVASLPACGSSFYFYTTPPPGSPAPTTGVTDSSGNLTLWLFRTPTPDPSSEDAAPAYNLTAAPLHDSGFDPATVQGITVAGPATLIVVLPGSHAPPVTQLTISPAANPDGTYQDPVTITLSATAAPDFFVDATFSSVDGGPQQQYTAPFEVAGVGAHEIRYFSTDSGGVAETPQVFNFTLSRPDHTPPTTTATSTPAPNAAGWNNSDVTIALTAVDNPGGSGVQQVTYSIAGAQATPPVTVPGGSATVVITVEGVSTVSFFATDNAGNVEATQSITVQLDKTTPEAYNQFDPVNFNVVLFGRDAVSGVPAGPIAPSSVVVTSPNKDDDDNDGDNEDNDGNEGPRRAEIRTYQITDLAGNVLRLVERVTFSARQIRVSILSLKYGSNAAIQMPFNRQTYAWTLKKGQIREIRQRDKVGRGAGTAHHVQATFVAAPNKTTIVRHVPKPKVTVVKPGLTLLRLATSAGSLSVEF